MGSCGCRERNKKNSAVEKATSRMGKIQNENGSQVEKGLYSDFILFFLTGRVKAL